METILIDSNSDTFKNYRSGVIPMSKCGSNPSHMVTLVDRNENYLTIQSDWGPNWGENGMAKIAVGACGTE